MVLNSSVALVVAAEGLPVAVVGSNAVVGNVAGTGAFVVGGVKQQEIGV
jgi:hypothetical protein